MTDRRKLVMLGMAGVGKTSIVNRVVDDRFSADEPTTIGAAFQTKVMGKTKLEIWDTAGQESYEGLAKLYYRGAHAAIIVYDITMQRSLPKAREWLKKVVNDQANDDIVVALAGNKCDTASADRQVDFRRAEDFAQVRCCWMGVGMDGSVLR